MLVYQALDLIIEQYSRIKGEKEHDTNKKAEV